MADGPEAEDDPDGFSDRRSKTALDLHHYAPVHLINLGNKIASIASAYYRPRFGIGVTDLRIMALLGNRPWISPREIAEATGLDKGAVSRSVHGMRRRGLIEVRSNSGEVHRQSVALTGEGLSLHDEIVPVAREREESLFEALDDGQRRELMSLVGRLEASLSGQAATAGRRRRPTRE
ncbi:MarR family winged helix-turn-helix transcriptional regulator [Afifella sp. IM 167]|uniref:MarR family winged helix-turn-helix transcriptional regulator n=1 Tax=Afifella sp. IM 167 TaxID=2033586 RepID=UPI001CCBE3AF|nr:MarR family winged helix-turn-helix transcriptional regulator [Afifella sp. IM 167]MBZ8132988.1 hypothetical protein [Afifella sp. IM 167]